MTAGIRGHARFCGTGAAIAAAICALVEAPRPAAAQERDTVTVDVGECVALTSADERFACYERRVAATKEADVTAATEQGEPPRADDARRRRRAEDTHANAQEPRTLVGTITELRETVPNSSLITLDNGQVWRQKVPKWYPLQPGQQVTLYPTKWGGSFRLTAENLKSFIQVERVR